MKIDFSQIGNSKTTEHGAFPVQGGAAGRAVGDRKTAYSQNIRLDITDSAPALSSTGIYDERGAEKNAAAVAASGAISGVAGLDMSVMHNYYAVMSNSMSGKDFAALCEEGFEPSAMEADELVTGLDRIKAVMARSGQVIEGYNDDLDRQELETITGSAARGAATMKAIKDALYRNDLPVTENNVNELERVLSEAESIESRSGSALTDGTIGYLLDNELPPTLENTFQSLSAGGRRITPLSKEETDALADRIGEVISEAGYEKSDEAAVGAKWILDRNIPLTPDSFDRYMTYRSLELPFERQELLDKACGRIEKGESAGSLLIVQNERIALEARLVMTSRANLALLSSDYQIDTAAMQEELGALQEREAQLMTGPKAKLFDECLQSAESIKSAPLAMVADIPVMGLSTIRQIAERSAVRADIYKKAGETYEAVGTQVRTDLGDSVKKAFGNVDEMLGEMKLEPSEENRRAVRILGYNRMEITADNLSRVKEADSALGDLLQALKPGAVMKLIKTGNNPLDMDMRELTDTLKSLEDESESVNEKYSRYLLKLEKNGEISEQEREGYIGIYRLFRRIEKSDGAALGSLINAGEPLTIKNLLSACRSRKAAGMDYRVDDDFGGVERVIPEGVKRIDAQIENGFLSPEHYRQKNSEILAQLDPGRLKAAVDAGAVDMETEMDSLLETVSKDEYLSPAGRDAARAASEIEAARIRQAADASPELIRALQQSDIAVTPNALEAGKRLSEKRGDVYRQLSRLGKNLHIARMIEDFDSKEGARAAIEDMARENSQAIDEAMEAADMTSGRLRGLMLMKSQLSLIETGARREEYEVPVEISGEITSIRVKMIAGTGESSMKTFFGTEEYGEMSFTVKATADGVSGYMIAENRVGEEFLSSLTGDITRAFEEAGEKLAGDITVMTGRTGESPFGAPSAEGAGEERIESSRLYKMAKIFLGIVSGKTMKGGD